MHGKERAIAPPLCRALGLTVTTAPGIDTDALGTFTGEIQRKGTMLEAARQKAKLAIARTGAHLGIGSEGSFGPDPYIPFMSSGRELLVIIEAATGREILMDRRTPTNFDHILISPGQDIAPFLERIGFPAHAVIVRPDGDEHGRDISKGICSEAALLSEIARTAARSSSRRAFIGTDMRAHQNPTRMENIARTARRLALKVARCCPACGFPGFGFVDLVRGLPCAECQSPTSLIQAELYGCMACGHRLQRRTRCVEARSDPTWCNVCNP